MLPIMIAILMSNGYSPAICKEIIHSLNIGVDRNFITEKQAKSLVRKCMRRAQEQAD